MWFAISGTLVLILSVMAAGAVAVGMVSLIFLGMLLVLFRRWDFLDLWEALHAAEHQISSPRDES